jgi:hypothetical protein
MFYFYFYGNDICKIYSFYPCSFPVCYNHMWVLFHSLACTNFSHEMQRPYTYPGILYIYDLQICIWVYHYFSAIFSDKCFRNRAHVE